MQESLEAAERSLDESHQSLVHLRAGDSAAVSRLINSVRPFLKHQVMEMIGTDRGGRDDASDIVQKTMLQAVEQIDLFQGDTVAQWRGWLCAIAKNKVIDAHRYWNAEKRDMQRVAGVTDAVQCLASPGQTPSSIVAGIENASRLELAMNRLDPEDRQLIQFRQIEGLPHSEIAQRLGITEATSRQRLRSAMVRLRSAWKTINARCDGV